MVEFKPTAVFTITHEYGSSRRRRVNISSSCSCIIDNSTVGVLKVAVVVVVGSRIVVVVVL